MNLKIFLTRPLKDLTKESIFNILIHSNKFTVKLENSNVLDLFSGVGSFGLECLSRGSAYLTFVENYNNVLPLLKNNIFKLNYQGNSTILETNIMDNLNFKIFKKKFDIIFIDPPYREKNLSLVLINIIRIYIRQGLIGRLNLLLTKMKKINFLKNLILLKKKNMVLE